MVDMVVKGPISCDRFCLKKHLITSASANCGSKSKRQSCRYFNN